MSNTKTIMSQASNQYVAPTYIEDVFSTYLYTGNSSTQTITNGIDLANEGGLVWTKPRSAATFDDHILVDSERGDFQIQTNTTAANNAIASFNFSSSGYVVPNNGRVNKASQTYASWTFRKAPTLFDVVTYTGDGNSSRVINHNLGVAPGFIVVKRTDATSNWPATHKDVLAAGLLNTADAFSTDLNGTQAGNGFINASALTDTSFQVISGNISNSAVNASGGTYVAYLFAHDPLGPSGDGSDGLIACGSFTGNGFTTPAEIDLGWEPQWVMVRASNSTDNWDIVDTMRGFVNSGLSTAADSDAVLEANTSDAENNTSYQLGHPTANGFAYWGSTSNTYIYIAIRRGPMRVPESGTEVFNTITRTGNGTTTSVTGVGFPPDLFISRPRTGTSGLNSVVVDRTRGAKIALSTRGTFAEQTENDGVTVIGQDGVTVGASQAGFFNGTNYPSDTLAYWNFRRAPNFFDVVAYTGNGVAGRTVPHNLGVAPEMMIVKDRGNATNWSVYSQPTGNTYALFLNLDFQGGVDPDYWNNTTPTDSVFTVGTQANVNGSSRNYIAYLFASLAGVSKVGSYTGNGTSQTIDCGFTTGARFVLIKRTDTTGNWKVMDTARGIVAAGDPYLELNNTNAEFTGVDVIDPDASGFSLPNGWPDFNASGGTYIFYAIA